MSRELENFFEGERELPNKAYWEFKDSFIKQQMQQLKADKELRKATNRLRKDYLDKLHKIFGEENFRSFQKLNEERIRTMQALRKKVIATRGGWRKYDEKRRENIEKSARFIKKAGIDRDALHALRNKHTDSLEALFIKDIGESKESAQQVLQARTGGDWMTFSPPYHESRKDFDADTTKGSLHYDWICDVYGNIAFQTITHIDNADNDDLSLVRLGAEIGRLFRIPRNCTSIGVIAEFESPISMFEGHLANEYGWSDYYVGQTLIGNLRIFRVWPRGPEQAADTWLDGFKGFVDACYPFFWETCPEPSWYLELCDRGDTVYTDYVILPGPFSEAHYVAVWVRVEVWSWARVNDFSVYSSIIQSLRLKNIYVHFRQ